jgi:hypothetical protein
MICQAINSTGMKQYLKCASVFACTPCPLGVPGRLFLHICRSTHLHVRSKVVMADLHKAIDVCVAGFWLWGTLLLVWCMCWLAVLDIVGMRAHFWGFENSKAKASQSEAKAAAHQASEKTKGLVVF